jgi:hypothetical protein
MTGPAAAPGIEVTFTVTIAMSPAQVADYATAHGITAPAAPRVSGDVIARLRGQVAGLLEDEYWIGKYTTVRISPLRLASWRPMLAAARKKTVRG